MLRSERAPALSRNRGADRVAWGQGGIVLFQVERGELIIFRDRNRNDGQFFQ